MPRLSQKPPHGGALGKMRETIKGPVGSGTGRAIVLCLLQRKTVEKKKSSSILHTEEKGQD